MARIDVMFGWDLRPLLHLSGLACFLLPPDGEPLRLPRSVAPASALPLIADASSLHKSGSCVYVCSFTVVANVARVGHFVVLSQ